MRENTGIIAELEIEHHSENKTLQGDNYFETILLIVQVYKNILRKLLGYKCCPHLKGRPKYLLTSKLARKLYKMC